MVRNLTFLSLVSLFFFIACKGEEKPSADKSGADKASSQATKERPPGEEFTLGATKLYIAPITAEEFNKLETEDFDKTLVEKFCKQSKGYQSTEWHGLNQCRWAIEKYKLDIVIELQRDADNLIIPTGKERKVFTHKEDTFYMFKDFYKKSGFYIIEQIDKIGCNDHILVQKSNGKETNIEGLPHMSPSEDGILVSSDKADGCDPKLEYWMIRSGHLLKIWGFLPGIWSFHDIKWESDTQFLAKKYMIKNPKGADQYIRVYIR